MGTAMRQLRVALAIAASTALGQPMPCTAAAADVQADWQLATPQSKGANRAVFTRLKAAIDTSRYPKTTSVLVSTAGA